MNRVIIAGGTGLIGRALADTLAPDYEVILLGRHAGGTRGLKPNQRVQAWDARTDRDWGSLVNGATAVVNLAGASIGIPPIPWTAARKTNIRESRVNAGRAINAAIRAASTRPDVVVQSSAVGYYGLHGDEQITEADSPGTDFLARVAIEWENATAEVETFGVRRVVVRTGLPLSRAGGLLPWFSLPFRFFFGGPLGSGRQWLSWIHMADEVQAIRFLIENTSARGPYNLCSPNPVTNQEFGHVLGRVIRRPSIVPIPAFAMKLALGELAELLLLNGQRVLPQRLSEAGFKFRYTDLELALRNLYQK